MHTYVSPTFSTWVAILLVAGAFLWTPWLLLAAGAYILTIDVLDTCVSMAERNRAAADMHDAQQSAANSAALN